MMCDHYHSPPAVTRRFPIPESRFKFPIPDSSSGAPSEFLKRIFKILVRTRLSVGGAGAARALGSRPTEPASGTVTGPAARRADCRGMGQGGCGRPVRRGSGEVHSGHRSRLRHSVRRGEVDTELPIATATGRGAGAAPRAPNLESYHQRDFSSTRGKPPPRPT